MIPVHTGFAQTAFADTAEAFWNSVTDLDGPAPISFDRCVDWLLDLYQDTTNVQLRTLISEVLDDLRELGPIEGEFEDLVLGALASGRDGVRNARRSERPMSEGTAG